MNQTKSIAYNDLFTEVMFLEKSLASLKAKLLKLMPVKYGSDLWWEKSLEESEKEYQEGKYITLKNKADIDKYFASIKK